MKLHYSAILCAILLVFSLDSSFAGHSDRYARIRYVDGDVTVYPSDGQHPSEVTVNSPVLDGDEIETSEGRVEITFRSGIIVRIGDYSTVGIVSIYSPMSIELRRGTLFVDSQMIDSFRDELLVRAGDAEIYLIDEGNMRVDLGQQGSVRVTTIDGEAEVRAAGRRVLLETGERTYVDPGQYPESPQVFNSRYDELDDWNESRMDLYAHRDYYGDRYVDESIYYDTYDLYDYGDWRSYGSFGYVWVPRVSYGWRPYYDGRWTYGRSGWFWVSSEPWGWAPYHYGRWGWSIDFGWYWIPGYDFGPSWVSWYDYGDYIGWCPLNYWNRPIIVYNYNYYNYPYVQKQKTIDITNAWTFVKKHEVGSASIKKISVPATEVKKIKIDEARVVKAPQGELVNYVMPKPAKVPALVNDKRVVKPAEDIHNPIGIKHRDEGFERGPVTNPPMVDKTQPRPVINPPTVDKTQPRPITNPPVVDKTQPRPREKSSINIIPEKNVVPKHDWESERHSTTIKPVPVNPRIPQPEESNVVIKKSTPIYDRNQQFDRNLHSSEDAVKPYRSYESPYYKEREVEKEESHTHKDLPWFRDPDSYEKESHDEPEISPRYLEEAKKVFERFEESRQQEKKEVEPKPVERYQKPDSSSRGTWKPEIQRGHEKQSSPKTSVKPKN